MNAVLGYVRGVPWLWVLVGIALGLWVVPKFMPASL